MKITIDVDCSAAEAREMLGLPDVRKLQEQWLKEIEKKIRDDMEAFSPEKILQSWTMGASSNMDMFANLLGAFASGGKK